jgi:LmbE family N-acetylglucosaminyl deacetylase
MLRLCARGLLLAAESFAQPVAARERLLKLETGASLLHVTAHPDDEHGGMLTLLSRGQGARVALVSLTRGEAGANAIGPELFDGLGWIRAEELAAAGRHHGLDALYFTRLADYGYSKRLSEAVDKWGREEALRDLVRIIRTERPLVVVSRFQGNERDGHGQHQFAGVVAREAFHAAGDGSRFPERDSIAENRYRGAEWFRGAPAPMATAEALYQVQGVELTAGEVVKHFEAQLPFGDVARDLVALPALSVSARPRLAILAPGASPKRLEVSVEVRNHASRTLTGRVSLELPEPFEI